MNTKTATLSFCFNASLDLSAGFTRAEQLQYYGSPVFRETDGFWLRYRSICWDLNVGRSSRYMHSRDRNSLMVNIKHALAKGLVFAAYGKFSL